jgi:hypothetical protein
VVGQDHGLLTTQPNTLLTVALVGVVDEAQQTEEIPLVMELVDREILVDVAITRLVFLVTVVAAAAQAQLVKMPPVALLAQETVVTGFHLQYQDQQLPEQAAAVVGPTTVAMELVVPVVEVEERIPQIRML